LNVLYGGLGIGKLQFLILKKFNFFSAVIIFQFLVIKALDPDWIRIGIQPKMLNPDSDEMNADPQPCLEGILVGRQVKNLIGLQLHFLILTRSEVISSQQGCCISNTSKLFFNFFLTG
jgi:hypothetical protein